MLIYNTTYQIGINDARHFVIYMHEQFIPATQQQGDLKNARLSRILSHKDPETECFSLQFEVESSARLHHWHVKQGQQLNNELQKLFQEKISAFSTLMEVID